MKYILFLVTAVFTFQVHAADSTSAYTPLDDKSCKTLSSSENDPNAEIDYFTSICPGRDNLRVVFAGEDSRSWISLLGPHDSIDQNDMAGITFDEREGQFPNINGSKLEWRSTNGKLTALIVRMNGQDADTMKSVDTLVVVRVNTKDLAKSCVIGVVNVRTQAQPNIAARDIADNVSLNCK